MKARSSTLNRLNFRQFLVVLPTCWLVVSAHASTFETTGWTTEGIRAPGLEQILISSEILATEVSFHLFVPPHYHHPAWEEESFPVLYWLHGGGGGTAGIPPLVRHYLWAMENDLMPPTLLVFPHGRQLSLWQDSSCGRYPVESVLIEELIPWVDTNYRTRASPEGRILEGFSMGGYGALRLGFRHPDLFGAITSFGGGPLQPELAIPDPRGARLRVRVLREVFAGNPEAFIRESPWCYAEQWAKANHRGPRIRLVIGSEDRLFPVNEDFHLHLNSLGIEHEYIVWPGVGHDALALQREMRWHCWAWYDLDAGNPALPRD